MSKKRTTITSLAALSVTAGLMAGTSGTASATTNSHEKTVRRVSGITPDTQTLSSGCYSTTLPIDCKITEPIVTQHSTLYNFSFLPGDHVTVNAGGCVQTGGSGLTWKRYVDPASDTDLYHGLITIPGVTGSLVRLVNVVGRQYTVGGRGGSLSLGYEDTDYSDNGYSDHDNGTGYQCLNSVNAWVEIFIS